MRSHVHIAFELTVWVLALTLGGAAWAYGLRLPEWTDPTQAEALLFASCTTDGRVVPNWWVARDALATWRWPLMDFGRGLILGTLTLAGFRVSALRDWRRPISPRRTWQFLAIGAATLLAFFAAAYWSIIFDAARQAFPPCADSIAIGLFGIVNLGVVALVIAVSFGYLVTRWFRTLPVSLFAWDAARPFRSAMWTLVFAAVAVASLAALAEAMTTSMFLTVPSCIVGVYLLAATRAALVAPPDVT